MTKRRATLWLTFICLVLCGLSTFIYQNSNIKAILPEPLQVQPGYYRVLEVYDGDTLSVDMNSTPEKVRLIGVDTPETHKPNTPVQCFGPEASTFTKQLLQNKAVRLEADPTNDNRDRYDRLLRYVYLEDGSLVEELLIAKGYGFAYTSFPFQKKDQFLALQDTALQTKQGLWASCRTVNKNGRWQTVDR